MANPRTVVDLLVPLTWLRVDFLAAWTPFGCFPERGNECLAVILSAKHPSSREIPMAEARASNPNFGRAFGEAKKNAAGVADDAADAAQEVYDQAADSASQVIDFAAKAARKTAGSFERALKNTIETQPYTAVAIALGIGWLLGRMHRPL